MRTLAVRVIDVGRWSGGSVKNKAQRELRVDLRDNVPVTECILPWVP